MDTPDKKLNQTLFEEHEDSTQVDISKSWLDKFEILKTYRKVFPQVWPKHKEVFNGHKLGYWIETQRRKCHQGKLPQPCTSLLEQLGLSLKPRDEALDEQWAERYQQLMEFRTVYPYRWPDSSEIFQDINVGSWCRTQKALHRQGKLSPERRMLLEEIGFKWGNCLDVKWESMYNLLMDYRKEHPDRWPPPFAVYKNQKLGTWCYRMQRSHKVKKLEPEKQQLLDELDFPWKLDFYKLAAKT